jgi:DeoR/GlpR family transcriptional regulator of sugar metabolism
MTVRRDLAMLDKSGRIKRVHGGARILKRPENEFEKRSRVYPEEKRAIGEAAADLIKDGETVFLDAGSTMLEVAQAIKNRDFENLRIVTHAVNITGVLAGQDITVVQLGGEIYRSTSAVVGQQALRFLESSRFDRCFLAAAAVNLEFGVSDKHLPEIDIKRAALQHARWTALVIDASKWGTQSMLRVASLRELNCIVTDARLEPDAQAALRNRGLEVVIAGD